MTRSKDLPSQALRLHYINRKTEFRRQEKEQKHLSRKHEIWKTRKTPLLPPFVPSSFRVFVIGFPCFSAQPLAVIPAQAEILIGYMILRFQSDALDEFEIVG